MVVLGVPKETLPGEQRVALTPANVARLVRGGFKIVVESGAGAAADFSDAEFITGGARVADPAEIWAADWVLKLNPPVEKEAAQLREGGGLIAYIFPGQNPWLLEALAARKANVIAMESIPRITRAQKMDALSSMANIAGYRAVVEAAYQFGRFFTGQITAAGKVPPAKVLIIGAGVAGLAAIGAARGLGAIVRAFDVRAAVRDEVQSMGAEFLELSYEESGEGTGGYAKEMSKEFIEAEMALFRQQAADVDIIITTASIPGRKAPVLLARDIVEQMKRGSVIVDLAAAGGGNCELTRPDEVVVHNGVKIIGWANLPGRLPNQASELYGRNLVHLLEEMGGGEHLQIDLENEIIRGAMIMHGGQRLEPPEPPQPAPKPARAKAVQHPLESPIPKKKSGLASAIALGAAGAAVIAVGAVAPRSVLEQLTIFVLAIVLGWKLVWDVTPALHTPLMSVTNAISGIIILGGMIQLAQPGFSPAALLGALAVLLAMINVAGGFLVTRRMLEMFHRD
ncbi:MAG: Re/Si-specific NAD(P)(+) transhydrogenase subunit alpha [Acidobacteria bacterium]|nr:Re/Si-specific NAD(P)(+) transhydrogenase subunit alpha [Acidobacteriota bacterium]MDA1235519.1 Re/Si-specific NAD(P)(+) transhydrogenase subunit alpha [Acidobacteriota bacterium]